MTVCIATSNYAPHTGGIATCYGHLATLLTAAGHNVVVLVPAYDHSGSDTVNEENGITVVRLAATYHRYYKKYVRWFPSGGLDAATWIAAGKAMHEWLLNNRQQYTIDIIETGDYGGLGVFLMDNNLPPVVITGHGTFTQLSQYNVVKEDVQTRLVRELEEAALRHADGIIAHSPANRQELETIAGKPVVLLAAPWQTGKGVKGTTGDYAIVAGGLQMIKGAAAMAEAVEKIVATHPGFQLYWIGGDTYTAPGAGKMSDYLANQFPAIWGKQFAWLNELNHEETKAKISGALLVIIPSAWEAFNYVALEAGEAGKAMVMTDKTGAAYMFTDKKDAWIVPVTRLAETITDIWEQKEKAAAIGEQAATTVEAFYNTHDAAAERISYYKTVVANNTPGKQPAAATILNRYNRPGMIFYYSIKKMIKKMIGR
ncbi:MAG: glycosyltransferase family 4 protein [Chitinophagaceae bacterium]|nr:glycosyltransferase family 4 protein [Chitinophagaceae bacterium]